MAHVRASCGNTTGTETQQTPTGPPSGDRRHEWLPEVLDEPSGWRPAVRRGTYRKCSDTSIRLGVRGIVTYSGHRSMETTMWYPHAKPETLRDPVLDVSDPQAPRRGRPAPSHPQDAET